MDRKAYLCVSTTRGTTTSALTWRLPLYSDVRHLTNWVIGIYKNPWSLAPCGHQAETYHQLVACSCSDPTYCAAMKSRRQQRLRLLPALLSFISYLLFFTTNASSSSPDNNYVWITIVCSKWWWICVKKSFKKQWKVDDFFLKKNVVTNRFPQTGPAPDSINRGKVSF